MLLNGKIVKWEIAEWDWQIGSCQLDIIPNGNANWEIAN